MNFQRTKAVPWHLRKSISVNQMINAMHFPKNLKWTIHRTAFGKIIWLWGRTLWAIRWKWFRPMPNAPQMLPNPSSAVCLNWMYCEMPFALWLLLSLVEFELEYYASLPGHLRISVSDMKAVDMMSLWIYNMYIYVNKCLMWNVS